MQNRKPRLRLYLEQSRNYRIFIGFPLPHPTRWAESTSFTEASLIIEDGEAVPVDQASSFIIAYPSGEILDMEGDLEPLPEGLYFIEPEPTPLMDILDLESLKKGEVYLQITHTVSRQRVKTEHYSTSLRNISEEKVRVLRFAWYARKGSGYILSTITGGFFTGEQFQSWYGVDDDGWIRPSQAVTDPNNYGSGPGYWVYFCIGEAGSEFTAGAPMPKRSMLSLLPW